MLSITGYKYFLTCVDACTKYTRVFPIQPSSFPLLHPPLLHLLSLLGCYPSPPPYQFPISHHILPQIQVHALLQVTLLHNLLPTLSNSLSTQNDLMPQPLSHSGMANLVAPVQPYSLSSSNSSGHSLLTHSPSSNQPSSPSQAPSSSTSSPLPTPSLPFLHPDNVHPMETRS